MTPWKTNLARGLLALAAGGVNLLLTTPLRPYWIAANLLILVVPGAAFVASGLLGWWRERRSRVRG